MADVETLLSEYIAEHKAGGAADPVAYLERVEGTDRAELAAHIDYYLAQSPGREWDAEAFRGSDAERMTEGLVRSLEGEAGLWPSLLPRLRDRAKVTRGEVVKRLAAALGVAGREPKVEVYYHQMEQGQLPSEGVSNRVLEALGSIVGASADALRRAGESLGAGGAAEDASAVFARTAQPDASYGGEGAPRAPAAASPGREPEWDEVDELFRGGPG